MSSGTDWARQEDVRASLSLGIFVVPPVAENLYRTLWDQDDSLTLNLESYVSAPAGELLSVVALGTSHEGSVTLNHEGTVTYRWDAQDGWFGWGCDHRQDSFTYTVVDSNGLRATGTVHINLRHEGGWGWGNSSPAMRVLTGDNQPVSIGLWAAADSDTSQWGWDGWGDGDQQTVTGMGPAAHGHVVLDASGIVTYTPDLGYRGADQFSYTVTQGWYSHTQTVQVMVDRPPRITPVPVSVLQGDAVILPLLGMAVSPEGLPLTLVHVSAPEHGGITINAQGQVIYTPYAYFHGTDEVRFQVSDGLVTRTATLHIQVQAVPLYMDVVVSTGADQPVSLNWRLWMRPSTAGALSLKAWSPVEQGQLSVSPEGALSYTPATGYEGAERFNLYLSEGQRLLRVSVVIQVGDTEGESLRSCHGEDNMARLEVLSTLPCSDYLNAEDVLESLLSGQSRGSDRESLDDYRTNVGDLGPVVWQASFVSGHNEDRSRLPMKDWSIRR